MKPVKPVVYLAGPYSKPDPVENMHRAIKIADGLLDVCVPMIPHLTGTWHMVSPKPYETWLELDLALMERCDVVYRFEGESSGADGEVAHAKRRGMPVVYSEEALREWIDVGAVDEAVDFLAFVQDMGACIDCPLPEGCPVGRCQKKAA